MSCTFCNKELTITDKVGRKDTCPHCDQDLHCCKQCKFYDQNAYNGCREVSAERVFVKESANFCDFFVIRGSKERGGNTHRVKDAKKALEALFNKKK